MATCIYCGGSEPETTFAKVEHVLPQAFGRFKDNLTLVDSVCDACNEYFGKELDEYLARDTIDGYNRFRLGHKPAEEFKSLGRRSTLRHHVDSGVLTGAKVLQKPVNGELKAQPLPQVGFGSGPEGPFKWFPRDHLPDKPTLKKLFHDGKRNIEFVEVTDVDEVLAELEESGVQLTGLTQSRPANWEGRFRVESRVLMEHRFARAIAKIAFNYLASQIGSGIARMPQFDVVRRYIRYDERPLGRLWAVDPTPTLRGLPHTDGHVIGVAFDPEERKVAALLSFHCATQYRVLLAEGGFVLNPFTARHHFFDLVAKRAREIRPST
jgi:hypothetical protein